MWSFVDPIAAGSTGELRLTVKFPFGSTPNGTVAVNTAQIEASNAETSISEPVPVTAVAESNWTLDKEVLGGTVDQTTYRIRVCRGDIIGGLNLLNVTITDRLPEGAIFVDADFGGQYNPASHTVTWSFSQLNVTSSQCRSRTVTIRFPSPPFNAGDTIRNEAELTGTPVGEPPILLEDAVEHELVGANPAFDVIKSSPGNGQAFVGDTVSYSFDVRNQGNVPLTRVIITDTIPPELVVTSIRAGTPNQPSGTFPIFIEYQTNLNPAWRPVPGSPFATPPGQEVNAASLGLAPGEQITVLRWDYGPVPVNFRDTGPTASGFSATVLATDRDGNPVNIGDRVVNCVDYTAAYPPTGWDITAQNCRETTLTEASPKPQVTKRLLTGNRVDPGGLASYSIEIRNSSDTSEALQNPVIADLLDEDLIYVADSWQFVPIGGTANAPAPLFEQIENYDNTGRTLLLWLWQGQAAYSLPPGEALQVTYQVQVKPGTAAGTLDNFAFLAEWDNADINPADCVSFTPDEFDLDGDGNTTELICGSPASTFIINSAAALESVKWVRGELDNDWTRHPNQGLTIPGGRVDYRLLVTNIGNVTTTNLVIIDILPYIGDTGVIDLSDRLSEWQPELLGSVIGPDDTEVFYSTERNPCRPELVPNGPPGCSPPNWSTTPPANITEVQSLKFNFNTALGPGAQRELIWPMRAPGDAPTNGEVTWNSFGYVVDRIDTGISLLPSEPFKVGIAIVEEPTAVELLFFQAERQGTGVVLSWATAVEIDNFGFRLLKSITGQQADAVEIGFVPGQGHGTTNGASYSFTDNDVKTDQGYSYWLVDVDLAGRETVHATPATVAGSVSSETETQLFLPLILSQ